MANEIDTSIKPVDRVESTEKTLTLDVLDLKDPFGGARHDGPQDTSTMVEQGTLPDVRLVDDGVSKGKESPENLNDKQLATGDSAQLLSVNLEPPGKVVQEMPSPVGKIIVYDNGTARHVSDNGEIYEVRKDGTEVRMKPDHSVSVTINGDTRESEPTIKQAITKTEVSDRGDVTYTYDDGTKETTMRGGGKLYEHTDGSSELYLGKHLIQSTDKNGTETSYDIDGNVEQITRNYPDYNFVTEDKDGNVLKTYSPETIREFKYDDKGNLTEIQGSLGTWKHETDKDGKSMWVNQESKQVWRGDFEVDPVGNLHYTPHKGQSWVFTRNGVDLPVEARKQ